MDEMTSLIRYWQPLERAFDRMRHILFEPFNLVTWMVLGFSAWLAHLAGGGGSGGNFSGSPGDIGETCSKGMSSILDHVVLIPLVAFAGLVVLALIALMLWLSSRGKFIFLDNVVNCRAEITTPWHRFKKLGDSLFLWRAAFVAIVIVVIVAGMLIPAIPAAVLSGGSFEDLSIFAMTSWGIFFGLVVLVVVVASLFVSLFLDAFVVPIMYRFDLSATEACLSVLACLLTCCIAALPYIGTVVLLPLWVTYRYFSLEWLAQFDSGFDVFSPLEPVDAENDGLGPVV